MEDLSWVPVLLDQLAVLVGSMTTPAGAIAATVLGACAYGLRAYIKSKSGKPAVEPLVLPPFGGMTEAEKKAAASKPPSNK